MTSPTRTSRTRQDTRPVPPPVTASQKIIGWTGLIGPLVLFFGFLLVTQGPQVLPIATLGTAVLLALTWPSWNKTDDDDYILD